MHFYDNPIDALDYYGFVNENGELNEFAEVESFGEILHRENKYCTTKLKFCDNCGTELDWSDSGEKNGSNPQLINGMTFEVISHPESYQAKEDDLHEKMLKRFERRETP